MVFVKDADDFQDWELLQSGSDSDSGESFNKIDSAALVQDNQLSVDAHNRDAVDLGDDKSDNPSWIEPDSEKNLTRSLNKGSDEILSDSGSERSECKEVRVEGIGEIFGEKAGELGNFCLESSEMEISSPKHGDLVEKMDLGENGGDGVQERRGIVWWNMLVELLKYCVLETSPPMLAVSVAAAVIAFVILNLGLCETKKKTRGLEIKFAIDDKKVSQARLNESFSIVKRFPMIRPSFPAVGLTNTQKNVLECRLRAA